MASEFYIVLPSNSSMVTNPNNTLAQYITNLPRRISLSGDWECGLTEIHYPHDWYNVRNSRMAVEYGESVHNVFLADGYYDSPETLVKTLNGEKPGRVQFSYNSVTQKVCAHMKNETKFTLYGDLIDILGFGKSDDAFRSRPVYTHHASRVRHRRNRDKGRRGSTSAIRTWEGDGDTSFSTAQLWAVQMNYDDYYARQVGGALPYFTGARVQRGYGFGSLFSGLLRSVAPLIKRGALALGNRALTTGAQIAGDVVAGQNVKKAAKRRATAAGRDLMQSLLATPPPPGKRVKRIKRATRRRRVTNNKRRQRTDVFS